VHQKTLESRGRLKGQKSPPVLVRIFSDIAHYADIKKKNKKINGVL
jgi:hypothetical protein